MKSKILIAVGILVLFIAYTSVFWRVDYLSLAYAAWCTYGIDCPGVNGRVDGVAWNAAREAAVKSGDAAGGDLGGTYPNPTVSQVTDPLKFIGVADDDDCTDQEGEMWYDSTDQAFEFCQADSGAPTVLSAAAAQGLDANFDIVKVIDGANSEANAVQIGNGTIQWLLYCDAGNDCFIKTDTPGDTVTPIADGFTWYLLDNEAGTKVIDCDPDAIALGSGTCTVRDPFIGSAYVDMEVCGGSPTTATVTVSSTCTSQGMFYNGDNDAIQFNLPAAASGKAFCFHAGTFAQVVTINPDDADTITLNGVAGSAGVSITSLGVAAEFICLHGETDGNWQSWGFSGTWAVGS